MQKQLSLLLSSAIVLVSSYNANQGFETDINTLPMENITDTATFGTGCFWCTEAIFQSLNGVLKATSGYMGGATANPTYEAVCTGQTGHAECIQVVYDPKIISYDDLLKAFWESHDPTILNRQGVDVGTQYRSVIFYHNSGQQKLATDYKNKLNRESAFSNPVVTEISPASKFYVAENYHQDYFRLNGHAPYCQFVIAPKLKKFKKVFKDKLKK